MVLKNLVRGGIWDLQTASLRLGSNDKYLWASSPHSTWFFLSTDAIRPCTSHNSGSLGEHGFAVASS